MNPHEIRRQMINGLRKAKRAYALNDAEGVFEKMNDEERKASSQAFMKIVLAIRTLENLQLRDIADKLREKEPEIVAASNELNGAVKNLENFQKILNVSIKVIGQLKDIATAVGIPIPDIA